MLVFDHGFKRQIQYHKYYPVKDRVMSSSRKENQHKRKISNPTRKNQKRLFILYRLVNRIAVKPQKG